MAEPTQTDSKPVPTDDELFRPLYPSLRRFAAVVAPLDTEPEDLLHDALVATLRRRRLADLDNPAAYLRRVIVNLSHNHRRRAGVRGRALRLLAASPPVATEDYPSDLSQLDWLSPLQRAVLYLSEVEGYRFAEIAEMVGCSEPAAPTHAKCWDGPPATTTGPSPEGPSGFSCAETAVVFEIADPLLTAWGPDGFDTLDVALTPDHKAMCIDLSNTTAGTVTIDVIEPGAAGELSASVRDSNPGDLCNSSTQAIDLRKGERQLVIDRTIPVATLNACGTEYGEAGIDGSGRVIDQTWDQDPLVPDPLVFHVFYGKSGPTTVLLEVTFEPGS
jgi:DNA-directed RNA polymerase specialized sigma24 family protein